MSFVANEKVYFIKDDEDDSLQEGADDIDDEADI